MTTPSKRPLSEKEFIQENYRKNPFPFWLWLFLAAIVTSIMWGGNSWFATRWNQEIAGSPFLQVTNREMSVFLWQFPEHMRVNARAKNGYLPGFQYQEKVTVYPELADDYVTAPPSLIFLYHSWKRLISTELTPRPIPPAEFKEFLAYALEWQLQFWTKAPKPYIDLVNDLFAGKAVSDNLDSLPETVLPIEVKQSFQGWKNYFKEGDAINKNAPTYADLQEFLKSHPHYARNYWRNIVLSTTPPTPDYLLELTTGKKDSKEILPSNEITPFLRVALFDYMQGTKELYNNKLDDSAASKPRG